MPEQPPAEPVRYHCSEQKGTLTLRGSLDIFEAQAIHAAALCALTDSAAHSYDLNLADVQRLDLSALQILAALRRGIEASGRQLCVPNCEALSAAAARAGWTL